jgi:predicted transcriptional regulator
MTTQVTSKQSNLNVKIDTSLKEKLQEIADREKRSLSNMVNVILSEYEQ